MPIDHPADPQPLPCPSPTESVSLPDRAAMIRERNARNARHSTGPRTTQGKAASARNGLKHGLRSRTALLPVEDPQEWNTLHTELRHDLQPSGSLQEMLVRRIATILWRLYRVERTEASLYQLGNDQVLIARATGAIYQAMTSGDPRDLDSTGTLHPDSVDGQSWLRLATDPDAWSTLSRYEAHLDRTLYRALAEYRHLQASSSNDSPAPP